MNRAITGVNGTKSENMVKARSRESMTMPKPKVEFHPTARHISAFSSIEDKIETNEMIRFHKVAK